MQLTNTSVYAFHKGRYVHWLSFEGGRRTEFSRAPVNVTRGKALLIWLCEHCCVPTFMCLKGKKFA